MWSIGLITFLEEEGYDIWYLFVIEYISTKKENTKTKKELKKH
jgi:hypothetical protein